MSDTHLQLPFLSKKETVSSKSRNLSNQRISRTETWKAAAIPFQIQFGIARHLIRNDCFWRTVRTQICISERMKCKSVQGFSTDK